MGKVEGEPRMGCTSGQQSINYNSLSGFYFSRQIIKRLMFHDGDDSDGDDDDDDDDGC